MLLSPVAFQFTGQPSDPKTPPPVHARYAGYIAVRLVAHTDQPVLYPFRPLAPSGPTPPLGGYRAWVLSNPSQCVTVIADTWQSARPRLRRSRYRRLGLGHGGESNSGAHQALPDRAHGAPPLHHQIARSLIPWTTRSGISLSSPSACWLAPAEGCGVVTRVVETPWTGRAA
jgi:hypothetical protein